MVQDAKVLPVVTRGAEALCSMGMGESEVSPIARQRDNAQRHTLRSAGMGSMPMSDSGRLIQPLSKRVLKDA